MNQSRWFYPLATEMVDPGSFPWMWYPRCCWLWMVCPLTWRWDTICPLYGARLIP
jgi:hypothetical protein